MRILSSNFLRLPLGNFRNISNTVIYQKPNYEIKIIKKNGAHVRSVPITNNSNNKVDKNSETSKIVDRSPEYRENEMKIQMLSKHLHEQVFGNSRVNTIDNNQIKRFYFDTKCPLFKRINLFEICFFQIPQ